MLSRSKRRRIAIAAALGTSITFAPACSVHSGSYGSYGSCSPSWYEDVGVALIATAVFVLAACSGGHGHYYGHSHGYYGYGYHGWHR